MDFEAEVIKRVQAGDSEAFAYLVKRYEGALFVLAGNLLSPSHRAEDLVQEVFLSAFQHIRRYDPRRGAFSSWLFRIARNACFNENKKKREVLNPDIEKIPDRTDLESDAIRNEVVRQLDRALESLPFEQRVVFILADIQGLSYEEIAEIEGLPLGTVKSRISRARNKLARLLSAYRESS